VIQKLLGHASIITTEIYTQVAIRKVKSAHVNSHHLHSFQKRWRHSLQRNGRILKKLKKASIIVNSWDSLTSQLPQRGHFGGR
jgi:hypothetical protein